MRIVLITLILSLFGYQAQAQKVDPSVRAKVLAARAEAIQVIREYSENADYDAEMRKTAGLMADLLEKSRTIPAVGTNLRVGCRKKTTTAYADMISQIITLCPLGLSSSDGDLVQTFVHEDYHLYEGIYFFPIYEPEFYEELQLNPSDALNNRKVVINSEKRASAMELEIMFRAYKCVYSETSYFEDLLGLVKGEDFVICKNKLHLKSVQKN